MSKRTSIYARKLQTNQDSFIEIREFDWFSAFDFSNNCQYDFHTKIQVKIQLVIISPMNFINYNDEKYSSERQKQNYDIS